MNRTSTLVFVHVLLCLCAGVVFSDDLPEIDPNKPLYQMSWGTMPPGNAWLAGKWHMVQHPDNPVAQIDPKEESAKMWMKQAKFWVWAILPLLLAWYFTKLRQLGGAAVVVVGYCWFCGIMAGVVSLTFWWVVLGVVSLSAVAIGFVIQDKSGFAWIRDRLSAWRARRRVDIDTDTHEFPTRFDHR